MPNPFRLNSVPNVKPNIAVIGVGSNIYPRKNILGAKKLLSKGPEILAQSKFIKTKPIGYQAQPDFTNGAFLIKTTLTRRMLRKQLKSIETQLGRFQTTLKYGPRTIDLDIIIWNNQVISKDFQTRRFVRQAALELLPNLKLTKKKALSKF